MPIVVYELKDSRLPVAGSSPADTLVYLLRGSDDEGELLDALAAEAATTWRGLVRDTWAITDNLAPGDHVGKVTYKGADLVPKDPGDFQESFDTSGGTKKIQVGNFDNDTYVKDGDTAPDFGKLIGVTDEGVEGVDIVDPKWAFQETWTFAYEDIDDTYKGILFRATGTTNQGNFRYLNAAECLFLGAQGTTRPDKNDPTKKVWDITFKFEGKPNTTNIVVSDDITIASAGGWNYIWLTYDKKASGTPKRLSQNITSANVAYVYYGSDFGALGI